MEQETIEDEDYEVSSAITFIGKPWSCMSVISDNNCCELLHEDIAFNYTIGGTSGQTALRIAERVLIDEAP